MVQPAKGVSVESWKTQRKKRPARAPRRAALRNRATSEDTTAKARPLGSRRYQKVKVLHTRTNSEKYVFFRSPTINKKVSPSLIPGFLREDTGTRAAVSVHRSHVYLTAEISVRRQMGQAPIALELEEVPQENTRINSTNSASVCARSYTRARAILEQSIR